MPITFLTDFGTADHYVAAMKGVILGLSPRVPIVDVTHEIPPQDVRAAAFTILAAYRAFPEGTIHVAVVDPGVGSARRPIAASAGGQLFVGPDNGLFSYVLERETGARVFHLTNERFFRHPVSATFHGRDVFAPVAGALASGVALEELGEEIMDPIRLESLRPKPLDGGGWCGSILHIDHFGNCITNLTPREVADEVLARGARITVKEREIRSVRRYFADESTEAGELFGVWGSTGFLEIAANRDSAARLLDARRGDPVILSTSGDAGSGS